MTKLESKDQFRIKKKGYPKGVKGYSRVLIYTLSITDKFLKQHLIQNMS